MRSVRLHNEFIWKSLLTSAFLSFLGQQRTRGHPCEPAAAAGRVCGDSSARSNSLPQRARERRPAGVGVHTATFDRWPSSVTAETASLCSQIRSPVLKS